MAHREIASLSREAYIDSGWFDCTLQTVFQSNRLYAGTRYDCLADGASVIEALPRTFRPIVRIHAQCGRQHKF